MDRASCTGRLSPSGRNIEQISKKIFEAGNAKNISYDIVAVATLYYISDSTLQIDIDTLLETCEAHKEHFIDAIRAEQKTRVYYAKPFEQDALFEVKENTYKLAELQTAIGIHYYNTHEKRLNGVRLLQEALVHNIPLAMFYLGMYYMIDAPNRSKYREGILLQQLFTQSSEDFHAKEAQYKKDVFAITRKTFYTHEEYWLLDYAIEQARGRLHASLKKLTEIQSEKDRLRSIAVRAITNAMKAVMMSDAMHGVYY
jgi:hypothetical protein